MFQREIAIPSNATFEDKQVWHVTSAAIGEKLFDHLKSQYGRKEPDFCLIDKRSPDGGLYPVSTETRSVVLGTKDQIQAWIYFVVVDKGPDVGQLSLLEGLRDNDVKDYKGKVVTPLTLSQYDGHKEYSGRGSLVHLGLIEAFPPGKGFGSVAIRYLQQVVDCELIEAEATGYTQEQIDFYERNGLKNVGIDTDNRHRMVMVWHNQKFARQESVLDELIMRKTWGDSA